MSDIELDIIKSFPLFSDLEENALAEIAGYIRTSRYCRDEDICRIGDINELLYIIKSGQLRVSVVDSGGKVCFQSTPLRIEGDFLIRPRVEKYDFYSFKDFNKIIDKGEEAAEEAIVNIKNTFNLS